jgi:hypothetical protein
MESSGSPAPAIRSQPREEPSRTSKRRQQRRNRRTFLELQFVSSTVSAQRIEELAGELAREAKEKSALASALERESKGAADLTGRLAQEVQQKSALASALEQESKGVADLTGRLAQEVQRSALLTLRIEAHKIASRACAQSSAETRVQKEIEAGRLRARLAETEPCEAQVRERDGLLLEASARAASASEAHRLCLQAAAKEAAKTKAATDSELRSVRFLNHAYGQLASDQRKIICDHRRDIKDKRATIKQLRFVQSELGCKALRAGTAKVVSFLSDKSNDLGAVPPDQPGPKRGAHERTGVLDSELVLCPGEITGDPIEEFSSSAPKSPSCDFVPASPQD